MSSGKKERYLFSQLYISIFAIFRTCGDSDCLLRKWIPRKVPPHSCGSTTASFLLRGIQLRRSGCYRSPQNNVLSGNDSSVLRRGKSLPFGDRRSAVCRVQLSCESTQVFFQGEVENCCAGCIVLMQNVVGLSFFTFNSPSKDQENIWHSQ